MKFATTILIALVFAIPSWAQTEAVSSSNNSSVVSISENTGAPTDPAPDPQQHPAAKILSPGYEKRAAIHRYASFATLPLLATELWLGQSLYNDSATGNDSKKGAHIAVGTGIIGLFGVNAVTGVWNMLETRKDPDGRTLRLLHGSLMLAASAGFAATAATGPGGRGRRPALTFASDRSTHRTIAVTSISLGTAGYLIMLLRGHH